MLLLASTCTNRVWSPLLATYRWYALAASSARFSRAAFVAKTGDVVYPHVPCPSLSRS